MKTPYEPVLSQGAGANAIVSRTFNMSRSSSAMSHSSPLSANCRKSFFRSDVIFSMALRYSTAKANMLKVEFHLVETSRGMIFGARFSLSRYDFHAGSKVVE